MGIKAHKRKMNICAVVKALSWSVGAIGILTMWAAADMVTYGQLALLPGGIQLIVGLAITTLAGIAGKATDYVRFL